MLAHIGLITWGYAAGELGAVPGTLWNLTTTYPGMLLALAGHAVPGDGGRHQRPGRPRPAALRVVAPAAPLRLPRRRPRPAAPALDRPGVPRLDGRHRLLVDAVGVPPPRRCSSGGSACPCGARCATACGSPRWCPRDATTSSRSTSPGAPCTGCRSSAGQFLTWRFLTGPGWTRAHPYSLSAAPDGRSLRITVKALGDGSALVRACAPAPARSSRVPTAGSPNGPAPGRGSRSSAPGSASPRCGRWPRDCRTRRATPCCCSARPAGRCSPASSTSSPGSAACTCCGCPAAGAPPTPGSASEAPADDLTLLRSLGARHRRARRLRLRPAGVDGRRPPHARRRRPARRAAARRELRLVTR